MLTDSGDAVLHFGNPLKEARAFESGAAFAVRSDLALIELTGEDRRSWLNSFTTQNLADLQPGQSAETLLLSPQGKIEQQIAVAATDTALMLMVQRQQSAAVLEFLQRMRFALRVEFADVTHAYAAVDFLVPPHTAPQSVLAATVLLRESVQLIGAATAIWCDPWVWRPAGGAEYAEANHPTEQNSATVRLIITAAQLERLISATAAGQAQIAGIAAVTAYEIALWRPTIADFDEQALPHEFDLLRSSVHLNKGCYRGQETVAKVHNLGHPPRLLTFLHLDGSGSELPQPAAVIYAADDYSAVCAGQAKAVGKITRAALHFEQGPIALGLLKRSAAVGSAPLWVQTAGGDYVPAQATIIVPPSAGAVNALSPQVRRAFLRR